MTRGGGKMIKMAVAVIFLLLTLGIIFIINLEFRVSYLKKGEDDELIIIVRALAGRVSYKFEVPAIRWGNEGLVPFLHLVTELENRRGKPIVQERITLKPGKLRQIWRAAIDFLPKYWKASRFLHRVFGRVKLSRLHWVTEFGTGDAADTGLAAGLLWVLKGWIWTNVHHSVTVLERRPELMVKPLFQNKQLNLDFDCIFTVSIGHIIITGIKAAWLARELGVMRSVRKGVISDGRTPD